MALTNLTKGTVVASEGGSTTSNLAQGLAKAWHSVDGDASTPVFFDSFNCASITDTATGKPQINFTNAMSNDDFAVGLTTGETAGAGQGFGSNTPKTTSSVIYKIMNSSFAATDSTNVDGIITGDLA